MTKSEKAKVAVQKSIRLGHQFYGEGLLIGGRRGGRRRLGSIDVIEPISFECLMVPV
jgi:hypothetical protein